MEEEEEDEEDKEVEEEVWLHSGLTRCSDMQASLQVWFEIFGK